MRKSRGKRPRNLGPKCSCCDLPEPEILSAENPYLLIARLIYPLEKSSVCRSKMKVG